MSAIEHFTRQGQLETAGEARPVRPAYRAWARYVSFRKIWAGAVAGTKHFAGPKPGTDSLLEVGVFICRAEAWFS